MIVILRIRSVERFSAIRTQSEAVFPAHDLIRQGEDQRVVGPLLDVEDPVLDVGAE